MSTKATKIEWRNLSFHNVNHIWGKGAEDEAGQRSWYVGLAAFIRK